MSEPFIKLHSWMATLGLTPTEMIVLAVINSFTEKGGIYFAGIKGLVEWTGASERTIKAAVKHLVDEGWVLIHMPASGRRPAALEICSAKIAPLQERSGANISTLRCKNFHVEVQNLHPSYNKKNNNINIPPYNPPKAAGRRRDPYRQPRRYRNPALNYRQSRGYTTDELKRLGIDLGEEFYRDEEETK